MKHSHQLLVMFAFVVALTGAAFDLADAMPRSPTLHQQIIVKAKDRMGFPPPDPAGTVSTPLTRESVQAEMDAELKAKFDEATKHSNQMLTEKGAVDAGWGFLADHFAEIDRDRDGYLRFEEVSVFMDARSPLQKATAKSGGKPVQIVE
ncbi:hypothetical protein [Phyllobacterium zundukense]|uniref:EF-hand domain-containing protein n=1 Tax=Phyllobacterium zundukense TaxID=1867719 RepID=A0A2N9VQA7_9HYPH|nr:hypothetical protein [Phyllobacterium zundukense]ATU90717.1 hypothetical protein BLM14_02940 [Phyllobacterium zundukense]PIO41675.1 hypothetical protein B5P45_27380 [Phyllobacterium zundukense]